MKNNLHYKKITKLINEVIFAESISGLKSDRDKHIKILKDNYIKSLDLAESTQKSANDISNYLNDFKNKEGNIPCNLKLGILLQNYTEVHNKEFNNLNK